MDRRPVRDRRPILRLVHHQPAPAGDVREPTISIVEHPADGGFLVEVLPPQPIGHDREFQRHRDAYGYASGLRMVTGWKLIDFTADQPGAA